MSEKTPTSGSLIPTARTSLLRASAIMASGTLVSRILGFVRNAMLLAVIGAAAGGVNAAFQTANTLPNLVFNILASGVFDALLVPQIVSALKRKTGDVYVNRLLTLAGTFLFLITVIVLIAAPLLVLITAAGYDPQIRSLAIAFSLLCLPQIFFYGVYKLLGELLNAHGVFGPYMWAPVVNNVVGIAGLGLFLALWGLSPDRFDVTEITSAQFWLLGGSATLGVIAQALFLLWPMKRAGIKFRPDFHFRGTSFGKATSVAAWTFATLGVSQFGVLSTNNLAALADTWGRLNDAPIVGISAYSTAFMIMMLPQSLISVSIATAVFTRLAGAAADGDARTAATQFHLGLRTTTVLTSIAMAMLIAASVPTMQVVVMPNPHPEVIRAYAWVLVALMPGVPTMAMILMSQRYFYAHEDARPVFRMMLIPIGIQIIIGWTLYFLTGAAWWVVGAAMAETASRITQGFIGLRMVSRHNPHMRPREIIRSYLLLLGCALASCVAGWFALWLLGVDTVSDSTLIRGTLAFGKVAVVSLVVLTVFLLVLRLVAPEETAMSIVPMMRRLRLPEALCAWMEAPALASAEKKAVASEIALFVGKISDPNADPETTLPSHIPATGVPVVPAVALPHGDSEISGADVSTALTWPDAVGEGGADTDSASAMAAAEHESAGIALSPNSNESDSNQEQRADEASLPQAEQAKVGTVSAADISALSAPPTGMPVTTAEAPTFESIIDPLNDETAERPALTDTSRPYFAPIAGPVPDDVPLPPADTAAQQSGVDTADIEVARRSEPTHFDPSKPVLIAIVAVVVLALVWAVMTALSPVGNRSLLDGLSPSHEPLGNTLQQQSPEQPSEPETSPVVAPVVTGASILSWRGSGDFPDDAGLLIDGDPTTFWRSRSYDYNSFAEDQTVTMVFTLEQVSTVTSLTLQMESSTTGGEALVRIGNADDPRQGTEVGTFTLGPEVTFTFPEGTQTDLVAVSFTTMPTSEGLLRAKVYEATIQ
ncbi:murein biosynthesis integral membrane protein MurJ [Schaalia suimastitidis]|uniref:murein biosynthesis integral membrane protein MurJ n=1 Tax=Schaalia suimastitidis TaxID=121163 RepID=UPI00041D1CEF|nr:lipid II flippase MurJ [Schaalia suimastitidis]